MNGLHDGSATLNSEHSLHSKSLPNGAKFERITSNDHQTKSDDVIIQRVVGSNSIAKLEITGELTEPVILGRNELGVKEAEYSRVQVVAKAHSKSVVIFENTGSALLAEDLELVLEPGSNLTLVTLQEFNNDSTYAARHHAIVDKDAYFKSITVTVGGALVRILPTVEFKAPGAEADLRSEEHTSELQSH